MFFGFDLTQAIEVLGYPGIFAIVLAESGLFFGVSLPGGSLLFTAGLLASQGLMNIWILTVVVLVAAILGDAIGYWFGSWVGPALWRRPDSRFFKKRYLEQTKDFFDKHGTRTIFLARFIPIIRTFAPIVAGVTQMHYRTFFTYNVLGAVVWGGGYTLAGYLLGEAVPNIENYLEYIVLGIIVVTMIPFFWHVWSSRQSALMSPATPRPRAVIFDLDDTLSESFQPPTEAVLGDLAMLTRSVPVAIMTGASFERVQRDVTSRMKLPDAAQLYVFTDNSAQASVARNGTWRELYKYELSDEDREVIRRNIQESAREIELFPDTSDTSRIIDRDTSVAWTALPHTASQHEKRLWDADGAKRQAFLKSLRGKLGNFSVMIGGKTTMDVTREGISKAFGVEWLAKELSIEPREMLFIGDSFGEGGNDAVVIPTGIQVQETSGPAETVEIMNDLLRRFGSKKA